jgi:hypothetical protein
VLFPVDESVVPLGGSIVAVLVMLPLVAVTFAVTVKVTLPPLGKVGITIPAPCISATVVLPTVGHAAPPPAPPQVTPVTLIPVATASLKTALFAGEGPALLTMIA